jgi:predicted site-specific integrase-resolvase
MYTIGEFAKRVGVAVHTLQRWDREGRLTAHRTLNNRRYYTEADVATVLGTAPSITQQRKSIVYLRVSSPAQKPDLANQRKALEQFCVARGIIVDEWVDEIGGGLNFQRKRLLSLVDRIVAGEIGRLIIAHKDRLARFGFDLIAHLCEQQRCELLVLNTESLSPEQEMVTDLMTIMHGFSSRLDGLRTYRKALKEALAHGSDTDHHPQDPAQSDA